MLFGCSLAKFNMKILILSPSNNIVGGVEHFSDYLKKVYIEAGHEVHIINGINNSPIKRIFSLIGMGAPYLGWKIGKIAGKENFDLLVTNGFLGWNIKKGHIINVQHGTFAASADRIDKGVNNFKWFIKKYIWGYFEKIAAKRAGIVVAVSVETSIAVKKYYGIKDVKVIDNTIDFNQFTKRDKILSRQKFSLPEDIKLILFVGRFEYGKGADIISDMLSDIIKNDCNIVVASNNIINLPGIISLNNIKYLDLPFLYSACDIFIFPSRHEGCSLALIEAMGCEIPFLTTNVGSVSEIIAKDPSFSNWVSSLDNFKEKLLNIINTNEDNNINERLLAKNLFSYESFSNSYLTVLNELIKAKDIN